MCRPSFSLPFQASILYIFIFFFTIVIITRQPYLSNHRSKFDLLYLSILKRVGDTMEHTSLLRSWIIKIEGRCQIFCRLSHRIQERLMLLVLQASPLIYFAGWLKNKALVKITTFFLDKLTCIICLVCLFLFYNIVGANNDPVIPIHSLSLYSPNQDDGKFNYYYYYTVPLSRHDQHH